MNELLEVKTNKQGKQIVSARDLYLGLGLNRSEWSRWYKKNILKNEFFKENIDWVGFTMVVNRGGKPTQDFEITLEFALYLINSAKTISSKCKCQLIQCLGLDNRIEVIGRREVEFIEELELALQPFGLEGLKQYSILNYRIDYYIPKLNIAIEYDENDHKDYSYEKHEGRQLEIEEELGCRFIRVSDKHSNAYNIGLVMKEMFEVEVA